MKILSFITDSTLVRGSLVALLFSFGMQNRLFAPPATPVPTYYGEVFDPALSPAPDVGSMIDIQEGPTTDTIVDYDIITPDGDLTPQNSEISSGGSFPASSFFDIFTDITIQPIVITPTNGPLIGDPMIIDLGTDGSISDPLGGFSSTGVWSLPDHSATWMLLLAGMGLLRLGTWNRRFRRT